MSAPVRPTTDELSPTDELELSVVEVLDLGVEGGGFDPDVEIASWIEVARLEAELEADLVGDFEGIQEIPAEDEPESAGGGSCCRMLTWPMSRRRG